MFASPSASLNGGESQVNFPDTETRSFSFKWEAATCAKSSLKTMGTLNVKQLGHENIQMGKKNGKQMTTDMWKNNINETTPETTEDTSGGP